MIINVGFDLARKGKEVKNAENALKVVHLKNVLKTGFAPIAFTEKKFIKLLNDYLVNPRKDYLKRKEIFNKYVNINPGKSGEIIGQKLVDLMNNNFDDNLNFGR